MTDILECKENASPSNNIVIRDLCGPPTINRQVRRKKALIIGLQAKKVALRM